jgi:hypothetical protein
LPELSRKARKGAEDGGLNRKTGVLRILALYFFPKPTHAPM